MIRVWGLLVACSIEWMTMEGPTPFLLYRRTRIPGPERWPNGLLWLASAAGLLFHRAIIPHGCSRARFLSIIVIFTPRISRVLLFFSFLFLFVCFFFGWLSLSSLCILYAWFCTFHISLFLWVLPPLDIHVNIYISQSEMRKRTFLTLLSYTQLSCSI